MRRSDALALCLAVLLGPACKSAGNDSATEPTPGPQAEQAPEEEEETMERGITITETTVGNVSGMSVGVGNPMEGSWTGPDGNEQEGLTVMLSIWDPDNDDEQGRDEDVHEGQELEIGGDRYTVAKIDEGPPRERGSVTLVPVEE